MGKTVNKSDPYERRWWRGVLLDNRTISALEWAEARYLKNQKTGKKRGKNRKPWKFSQGSYNKGGVGASAGTHDGGGAVDWSVTGMGPKQIKGAVKWTRKAGFATYERDPIPGTWGRHIHGILLGHRTASSGAKQQMDQYRAGRNALANNQPDREWRPKTIPRWSHRQNKPIKNPKSAPKNVR